MARDGMALQDCCVRFRVGKPDSMVLEKSPIPGLGFGMGPEITYIPYRVASVWFVDRKVDSWERAR